MDSRAAVAAVGCVGCVLEVAVALHRTVLERRLTCCEEGDRADYDGRLVNPFTRGLSWFGPEGETLPCAPAVEVDVLCGVQVGAGRGWGVSAVLTASSGWRGDADCWELCWREVGRVVHGMHGLGI